MKMKKLLREVKARAEAKFQENPKGGYLNALEEAIEEVTPNLTADQKRKLLVKLARAKQEEIIRESLEELRRGDSPLDELRGKTRKLRDEFYIFTVKLPEDLLEDIPEDILKAHKDPEDPS